MTVDLNDEYGVTISHQGSGSRHVSTGEIFKRSTMKNIGIRVEGTGRTRASASERAIAEAYRKCPGAESD